MQLLIQKFFKINRKIQENICVYKKKNEELSVEEFDRKIYKNEIDIYLKQVNNF